MQAMYLVEADPARHSGLHTLTSPFVLTAYPSAGDKIAHVFVVNVYHDEHGYPSGAFLSCIEHSARDVYFCEVNSHPGRSAMLGEDGLEEEGGDCLGNLWVEALNRSGWRYAPVSAIRREATDEDINKSTLNATCQRGSWSLDEPR